MGAHSLPIRIMTWKFTYFAYWPLKDIAQWFWKLRALLNRGLTLYGAKIIWKVTLDWVQSLPTANLHLLESSLHWEISSNSSYCLLLISWSIVTADWLWRVLKFICLLVFFHFFILDYLSTWFPWRGGKLVVLRQWTSNSFQIFGCRNNLRVWSWVLRFFSIFVIIFLEVICTWESKTLKVEFFLNPREVFLCMRPNLCSCASANVVFYFLPIFAMKFER